MFKLRSHGSHEQALIVSLKSINRQYGPLYIMEFASIVSEIKLDLAGILIYFFRADVSKSTFYSCYSFFKKNKIKIRAL